jgi:hypothetical protein
MKKIKYLTIALFIAVLTIQSSNAQVCAIPTNEGSPASLSGTVNTYWSVANGIYDSSSSTLTLQNRRGNAVNIASGDLVLVIQMQCADINLTDTDAYGDGVVGDMQFNSLVANGYSDPAGSCLAGEYEFVRAGTLSDATTLDLADNPLVHTYIQATGNATTSRRIVQVIRVPQYNNATLTANIITVNWNGFSGGVVALDVARTLDFAGNRIIANGNGFRGGGGRARSANDANIRYRWDVDDRHAVKGEGIAGTPRFVSEKRNQSATVAAAITDLGATWRGYPNGTNNTGDFARGAPANAGGGGTFWNGSSDNGGGGGGGNGGTGGRGGAGWRSAGYAGILADYSNLTDKKWGFGGSAFSSASISRLVLGGGGAAGDNNNNSTPQESSGAAGGGIVMIHARSIIGTGRILARGARAVDNSLNDGAGAGGAGGSILVVSSDMTASNLIINASGGRGGDPWITGASAHGTGGGGGGGVVILTGAATVNVNGGANGLTNTNDSPPDGANHGAKPGSLGLNLLTTVPADIPGINTGFRCLDFGDAPTSYGLADHNLGKSSTNLYLGMIKPDGNPETITNIPSANADTDDLSDTDDEDGTTLPTTSAADGTYTVTTTVLNNTGSSANLCGWIDFDQDGIFQSDESVCTAVTSMVSSQSIDLVFSIAVADRDNTGAIFARLRLTTDALTPSNPTGSASDGEVEDFMTTVSTLPVSINGFKSQRLKDGLLIEWSTASETRNMGFYIWGYEANKNNSEMIRLTKKLIPTQSKGALIPETYQITLPDQYKTYTNLAISAIDSHGNEELFGQYDVGKSYGRKELPINIDWQDIHNKIKPLKNTNTTRVKYSKTQVNNLKAQLHMSSYGMHRINYEELLDAGFDLDGVDIKYIAVSVNNQAVARRVGAASILSDMIYADAFEQIDPSVLVNTTGTESTLNTGTFGAGKFIDFWAESPTFPDAEYLDHYTYEISINQELVKPVSTSGFKNTGSITAYQKQLVVNEDNAYAFTNSSVDPWYAKMLRDYASEADKFYQVEFTIDNGLVANIDGSIGIKLIGGSDLPINPDHQIEVIYNGTTLQTFNFDGIETLERNIPLPAAILTAGNNTVEIKLTGGTQALFDLVLVDEVSLSYPKSPALHDDVLTIDDNLLTKNISIPTTINNLIAYAKNDANNLTLLEYNQTDDLTTVAKQSDSTHYWISSVDKLNTVSSISVIQKNDLLSESGDYLLIVHPAFLANANDPNHPLNRYIQHRQAQGWRIKVISIADIQAQYGGGMALPGALTNFLKSADMVFDYSHILLVGSDSYDYKDKLGLQSISFIPTKYASTLFIPHTPSDQLLADLDGDGISDKAIGRWPVRTLSDLNVIVDKSIKWDNSTGLDAVFVTDAQDGNNLTFEQQSQRLIDLYVNNNWNPNSLIKIYTEQMDPNTGVSAALQVKQQMFEAWNNSKTLTSFIGHGSPTQWSRSGILNANDVDALININTPTLIGTLTCYTSYFVSPQTNTLAHRLLNGSNDGTNGAVAVHGAASLSAYSSNELFAMEVLRLQLRGKTLGIAINEARKQAWLNGYKDQVINWTLLGDPTIRVNPNN